MKEYTVTFTVDVTEVLIQNDDGIELNLTDERFIPLLEKNLKTINAFDDVCVRNFKVFMRDLDSEEESEKDDDQN